MSETPTRRAWFGVAAYSFPCGCGFARREGQPAIAEPLNADRMIGLAVEHTLSGIEIPLGGMLPDLTGPTIERLRGTLAERGLGLVVDSGIVDVEGLRALLPLAARAGAKVVRATLSGVLEGERARVPGGWPAHMREIGRRIGALRDDLERHDIILGLEDHQDATADDLLELCAIGGERVGVTFDVVNPLAVGEEPFEFARKIGPKIVNVHLKDYRIHATGSGYRLARCALGEGVIDWAAMRALVGELAPAATFHIELAALYARHIRLFEDDWLAGFPPRDARELAPALRMLAANARPSAEPWQSPWERGDSVEATAAWERDQFERSVAHLKAI